jgi:hypothetical protein
MAYRLVNEPHEPHDLFEKYPLPEHIREKFSVDAVEVGGPQMECDIR